MIDVNTFEKLKLSDVAEYERSKKDYIYPTGTSTLQISASRGQIGFLECPSTIEPKNVAIVPIAGVDPYYLNIILQKNIDEFMNKYATGINIQEKEVGNFPIQLHNYETQLAISNIFKSIDKSLQDEIEVMNHYKDIKDNMLSKLMI